MSDETAAWHVVEYEGFEIHAAPLPVTLRTEAHTTPASASRYTYVGYVCHSGADPAIHFVPWRGDFTRDRIHTPAGDPENAVAGALQGEDPAVEDDLAVLPDERMHSAQRVVPVAVGEVAVELVGRARGAWRDAAGR